MFHTETGSGAPVDSFQHFVDDFTERTRELKSLLLLRSSEPDSHSQKVMEEMEGALTKAERSMNMLKCKVASECKSIRRAEELISMCNAQAEQADSIKKACASMQSSSQGRSSTGGEQCGTLGSRSALARVDANTTQQPAPPAAKQPASATADETASGLPPSISPMTAAELQGVPQYVKGRNSLGKINGCVTALNDVLAARAELLVKAPHKLSEAQRDQVKAWKELQAAHGTAQKPVLREEDLRTAGLKLPEASSKEVLGVLRHCQRMREVKGAAGDKAYVCC